MERLVLILIFLIAIFFVDVSTALDCYSFDGFTYPDQQICPGTSACCGTQANCTENRLCENKGEREGTFVRGPCAVHPWDPAVCATICLYDERPQGGVFPRATVCNDGSFCCDNDSGCCANGRGVFLDRAGNIINSTQTPSSTGTTSTSPTSATASSSSSSPSISDATTTASNTPSSSSSLSNGAKVGLGVGITFGIILLLVLAFIAWILWRRRQPSKSDTTSHSPHTPYEQPSFYPEAYPAQQLPIKNGDQHYYSHELPPSSPQELDAPDQAKVGLISELNTPIAQSK